VEPGLLGTNLEAVRQRIAAACQRAGRSPAEVRLIAVSKGVAPEVIGKAFELGLRDFGENRVQEAQAKINQLCHLSPVCWHMIGHLQSNKLNQCIQLFDYLQSLDSSRLAAALSRHLTRPLPVLLQLNLAAEPSKGGFSEAQFGEEFASLRRLPNLDIRGLMMIAPVAADPESLRPLFRRLRQLGDEFALAELSMGMSDDFEAAIEEGATMVRIGRAIFGPRT
jgi:pyridoxal phosphate enzyme (YggS family)